MKCYLYSSLNSIRLPECVVSGRCSFRRTASVVHLYGIFLFLTRNFLDKFSVTQKLNHTFDTEVKVVILYPVFTRYFVSWCYVKIKKNKINFLSLSAIPLRGIEGKQKQ